MKSIIIEDQPPAQRILKKYIADYGQLDLVGIYADALSALEFMKSNEVDLIFLDIHLPKLSGLDFMKTLQNPPPVILTTAFPEFALESYELDAVDYLLKPFSFSRFIKAVSKVLARDVSGQATKSQYIFVKVGYEYVKVNINDILYINSDTDYTELNFADQKMLSSETLKFWENELDAYGFYRIHKSFLINKSKIKKIRAGIVLLDNGKECPVGRAYKEAFEKEVLYK